MDFSSLWQRKHLFAKNHPLVWTLSKVKVFPHVACYAKNPTLSDMHELQMTFIEKETKPPSSKAK